MADPVAYPQLGTHVLRFWESLNNSMVHIAPTSAPYPALAAPVTEIVEFTLRAGAAKADLEGAVEALARGLGEGEAIGPAWGRAIEREDVLGLFIGWTSVEVRTISHILTSSILTDVCAQAHEKAVAPGTPGAALVAEVRKFGEISLGHVALNEY